ncbi:type II CRISPR RNA-guided endonuclease Cas9 [soil metagenome]
MSKILGLDLGTNSIGWALIEQNATERKGEIIDMGSRIIPMSQEILGDFDKGNSISQTAERTGYRGVRRLRERQLLRRERLHRVLNIIGFLPEHYADQIDFEKKPGQFIKETEPKLAYKFNDETKQNEFLFRKSFDEMLKDFAQHQPELVSENKKVPFDWTIYYLRKKALTSKIQKEELAWLLLNFNQKRGYYQLRGEDEEDDNCKLIEFHSLNVVDVKDSGDKKGKDEIWYNVILENGWIYRRTSKTPLDWIGKTKEFIVTTELNEDGSIKKDKDGKERRSFKAVDSEKDWIAIKKSTEEKIQKSNKTVGSYIYDTLLKKPEQKINGNLVRTIERKFYKAELQTILNKQKEFHIELNNENILEACIEELYRNNEAHRNNIGNKDFTYLFLNDIIFYQRPLKSKKSLISNCRYESRTHKNKEGKLVTEPIKAIAKSHPLFQEFRLWQWMKNLKVFIRETDQEVTTNFLQKDEDWVNLFEWLNERKEVDQKAFLKYPAFNLKKEVEKYRWNFVEDKSYPCNETHSQIKTRLSKVENVVANFLTKEIEESLWHILYSVEDKNDIQKALTSFAKKHGLDEGFVEQFKKYPRIEKEYGSYSAKAIKKLLPLMRMGKYWNETNVLQHVKSYHENITSVKEKIKHKASNEKGINTKLLQKLESIDDDISAYKGLELYIACYAAYGRHSEEGEVKKWYTANEIQRLEQHSLRNPIVEQVINETLQVVKDIWKTHGQGKENFFDEIHIELGREMKNPSDKRKQMTSQITENENTNLRIKALLAELMHDNTVENVRPYSPSQQEILKIYEEGIINAEDEIPEDILKISKTALPTKSELIRYKLWLQQGYASPYTGAIIPLNKLFTPAYEIEHIIPQSRYFDDSFSNKVICEAEVNKLKDNQLAFEFIKNHGGEKVTLNFGRIVEIKKKEDFESHVKKYFAKTKGKMKKLLMEDIPETFIQRQLNDSRYISKVVKNLLSNIVREEGEQETTSKNVISSNGSITSTLKQDWGLNEIWNELIAPRFIRMNALTNSTNFGELNPAINKFLPQVPLELQKGFNKKRIDHRHHSLDALVIACATRSHINYLNNEYALSDKKDLRFDLRNKICFKKYNTGNTQNYKWTFFPPWENFTLQAKESLFTTLVSFKQNLRVINKTINHFKKWKKDEEGQLTKVQMKQSKGDNWAIRKPLHKETVYGGVSLHFKKTVVLSLGLDNWESLVDKALKQQVKLLITKGYDKKQLIKFFKENDNNWNDTDISKVEIYYLDTSNVASREKIDESFNQKRIQTITDTGIQKILSNHLRNYNEINEDKISEHPELAFSTDGLDELNKNIKKLNGGKAHHPIYKVRTYEPKGNKFNVGESGNKKDKFVVAADGTNLFFAVYIDKKGHRNYEAIPLNIIIENQKQGAIENKKPNVCSVPTINETGDKLLFFLSPNDLVYLPSEEERENPDLLSLEKINSLQVKQVYKFIDGSGTTANFIPNSSATTIFNLNKKEQEKRGLNYPIQNEYGVGSPQSKNQKSLDGIIIKEFCWKLEIGRLGNIKKIIK